MKRAKKLGIYTQCNIDIHTHAEGHTETQKNHG